MVPAGALPSAIIFVSPMLRLFVFYRLSLLSAVSWG